MTASRVSGSGHANWKMTRDGSNGAWSTCGLRLGGRGRCWTRDGGYRVYSELYRRGSACWHDLQTRLTNAPRAHAAMDGEKAALLSALKHAREARTVWVGAVPEALAKDEPRLADVFQQFGDVDTITARVKDTATHGPGKSWAFVGFVDVACAKVRLHAPAPPRLRLASTCAPAPPASAGLARDAIVNPGGCVCSDVSSRERWWSTVAR